MDGIIAVGNEAGGHIGAAPFSTLTLIPEVVETVKVPVVAGGGICDGKGFAAALALGAQGVYMASRFIPTKVRWPEGSIRYKKQKRSLKK